MAKAEKKVEKNIVEPLFTRPEPAPMVIEEEIPADVPDFEEPEPTQTATSEPQQPEAPKRRKAGPGRPSEATLNAAPTILDWLAEQDMEGLWVYAYRMRPITNRLLMGSRHTNVARFDKCIDEEDLKQYCGSGVYLIKITKLNPTTGKRPEVRTGEVRILDMNFPPKIPPGEWVDDPKNKEWEWAKEIIFKKKNEESPSNPLVEILREQIATQRQEMIELRREMQSSGEKIHPLVTLLAPLLPGVIQKLTAPPPPPPPPPPPTPNPLEPLMLEILRERLTAKPEPAAAPKDGLSELERHIELQRKLDEISPRHEVRSRKSGLQETIVDVAQALGPTIAPIGQVIAAGMMRAQQQAAMQQPQQPGMGMPPQVPPPMIQQPEAHSPQQPPAPGPQLVQTNKPRIEDIATAVLDHLKKGKNGFQLGDWYLKKYGEEEFSEARAQGKPQIMADLQTVPNTWRFIAEYLEDGQLNEMIKEFVTWEPPDDDDEDDDDGEEAEQPPAPPIAAGGVITTGWGEQQQTGA